MITYPGFSVRFSWWTHGLHLSEVEKLVRSLCSGGGEGRILSGLREESWRLCDPRRFIEELAFEAGP